jgi:hypothetical protein
MKSSTSEKEYIMVSFTEVDTIREVKKENYTVNHDPPLIYKFELDIFSLEYIFN